MSFNNRSDALIELLEELTVLASYAGSIYLENTDNTTLWSLNTAYTQSSIEITTLEIEFIQLAATITIMGTFLAVLLSKSVRIRNESMLLSTLRDLTDSTVHLSHESRDRDASSIQYNI